MCYNVKHVYVSVDIVSRCAMTYPEWKK